ncbi:hypothetical protein ABT095_25925 [Kitasatospora sp. NPDC002227]|uniref:hypothetical protein n=1 Tax=Kitasatospora sp. NPDC002227 TaxID=3154773 RepID=UPI0033349D1B
MAEGRPEADELRARIAELEARPVRGRVRACCAALLILLAVLLTPLSVLSAWAKSQVTDTDRYLATVAPLATDPAVRAAVTDRVTTAVAARLPVDSLLDQVAPADRPLLDAALGRLGSALTGGLTALVHREVQQVVDSDAFATVWVAVNRQAHDAVDRMLTGQGGGAVQLQGDTVTLDLAPVVDQVKGRLVAAGIGAAAHLPEIHTDYVLIRSDALPKVRTGMRLLQLAGFWLPVLALACAVGGVLLATRRRRAAVTAALGAAAGAALLGLGLTAFRALYLDRLPAGVDQAAARAVYDALTHYLRTTVRAVVVLGVLVAFGAWVSGGGRRAGQLRQLWRPGFGAVRQTAERFGLRLGPVGRFVHRWKQALGWLAVALAVLVLVLWDYPSGSVLAWLGLGLLAVLGVLELLDEPEGVTGRGGAA